VTADPALIDAEIDWLGLGGAPGLWEHEVPAHLFAGAAAVVAIATAEGKPVPLFRGHPDLARALRAAVLREAVGRVVSFVNAGPAAGPWVPLANDVPMWMTHIDANVNQEGEVTP
jgi:hypothetical protein